MRVDAFDFDLPEECIAVRPASPRDAARMLVVRPGETLADANVAVKLNHPHCARFCVLGGASCSA
mgnify:CR=1 FL=1